MKLPHVLDLYLRMSLSDVTTNNQARIEYEVDSVRCVLHENGIRVDLGEFGLLAQRNEGTLGWARLYPMALNGTESKSTVTT
jgi:hypothetical protein